MNPRYYSKGRSIVEQNLLVMNGNRMLIELLSEGEKTTKSGIITDLEKKPKHLDVADKARVAIVLAVGPGYETEEGELVAVAYQPGDLVLVNQFGVKTFGEFFGLADYKADSIALATEDLIQGRIGDFEKFNNILRG